MTCVKYLFTLTDIQIVEIIGNSSGESNREVALLTEMGRKFVISKIYSLRVKVKYDWFSTIEMSFCCFSNDDGTNKIQ
jgi:hypothetical protein